MLSINSELELIVQTDTLLLRLDLGETIRDPVINKSQYLIRRENTKELINVLDFVIVRSQGQFESSELIEHLIERLPIESKLNLESKIRNQ